MLLSNFYEIKLGYQQIIRYLIQILISIGNPPNILDVTLILVPIYFF